MASAIEISNVTKRFGTQVAVNGVSLTVASLNDDMAEFTVSLIPTTLQATTLGRLEVGDHVNLEVDVLAKYVERLVAHRE